MSFAIITILIAGTTSGLLMCKADSIARALWPGPGVKGPGDVYVQAFQNLLCISILGLIVLVAAILSFILSKRAAWPTGQWLSTLPLLGAALSITFLWLSRR